MNFGRDLKPPKSFFEDQTGHFSNPRGGHQRVPTKVEEILEISRKNMAKARSCQARYFNRKRSTWSPKINELVYKRELHQSKAIEGFAARFAPNYGGPFRIKNYISPSIVEVVDATDKAYRVHLKDLKKVNSNNNFSNN